MSAIEELIYTGRKALSEKPVGRIAVISFASLAVLICIIRLWPTHKSYDVADFSQTKFVLKCQNPSCGEVVEWTGSQIEAERRERIHEDVAHGGQGYPLISLACPKCGKQLLRAERLPSGEVRFVGVPVTEKPPSRSKPK